MKHVIAAPDGPLVQSFSPPAPALAPDDITGLGVLLRIKRNAFSAFPSRCFNKDVMTFRLPGRDLVLANTPDAMRHVFSTHHECYRRVRATARVLGPILGRGLAAADGDAWRRRTLAPAFTPRTLPILVRHIAACAETTCRRLEMSDGGAVDLLATMQDLSLDIAAHSMFSLETATFGAELRRLLVFYATSIGRPRASDFILPASVPTPTDFRRRSFRRRWRELIRSIIGERRRAVREAAPRDLFDLLADAYATDDEDLLVDEVSTMIFAGHETTGLTLFWACYLLANDPNWQEAVRAEAHACDLTPNGAAEALDRLPATRAVVEETLRLYPPAYMSAREADRAHEICGTKVRSGSLVLLPLCMLHRNPELWSSPSRFDPSRFLGATRPDRYAYLPFGAGPRICIGAQLATAEAVLVLARLLRDNELCVKPGEAVLPVGSFATRPSRVPAFRLSSRRRRGRGGPA